jgi:hypothetical protein
VAVLGKQRQQSEVGRDVKSVPCTLVLLLTSQTTDPKYLYRCHQHRCLARGAQTRHKRRFACEPPAKPPERNEQGNPQEHYRLGIQTLNAGCRWGGSRPKHATRKKQGCHWHLSCPCFLSQLCAMGFCAVRKKRGATDSRSKAQGDRVRL